MLDSTTATREHTISCGHRVVGHEGKCKYLHGHNYTIHITCQTVNDELDSVGRVVDFSVIKSVCCEWLEREWDHRLLLWHKDPFLSTLLEAQDYCSVEFGIAVIPFNPTAENMAQFLLHMFNDLFKQACIPVRVVSIKVDETPKCSAQYSVHEEESNDLRKTL